MKSSGFSNKLLWLLPILLAFLVGMTGWWANRRIGDAIKVSLRRDMESALAANVTALEIWFENQKKLVKSIANDPEIRSQALQLIADPDAFQLQAMLHSGPLEEGSFEACLQQRVNEIEYFYAFLANPNMEVVHHFLGKPPKSLEKLPETLQPKLKQVVEFNEAVVITPFKRPIPGPGRKGGRSVERSPRFQEGQQAGGRFPGPDPSDFPPDRIRSPRRESGPSGGRRFPRQIPDHLMELMQQDTMMQVAAPVAGEDGEVKGTIAFFIDPEREFSRIMSVARPGESGETYAFDASGLMVSMSRFDDQLRSIGLLDKNSNASSALNLYLRDPGNALSSGDVVDREVSGDWPLTLVAQTTLDHVNMPDTSSISQSFQKTVVEPFRDYRGVDVVAAWTWLPKYQLGMATQIDAQEAYRPLLMLRWVFIVLILLLLLASVVIFLISVLNVRWKKKLAEVQLEAKRLGQYHLEDKIGEGGMGSVYRARHALLRRETAVKLLTPDKADELSLQRFEREVKLTSQLTHPNTIQIYDYGHTPEGLFYYAMEYLDGVNLKELVIRDGPQSSSRVVHILRQICDSLQEAHRAGLIHRDIKPANIILCERGGVPDFVKVLDFGLVRHYGASNKDKTQVTMTSTVSGTPQFLAPEAIRNPDDADPRSDIYAIGAVGYFLVTGHYVFEGQSMMEIFEKHLTQAPVPPSEKAGTAMDPALEALLLQCLSKDLSQRPHSVAEMAEQLGQCEGTPPWTLNDRVNWWAEYRQSQQWARQNPSMVPQTASSQDKTILIDFHSRA
jgi:serine/threonine protein kinase